MYRSRLSSGFHRAGLRFSVVPAGRAGPTSNRHATTSVCIRGAGNPGRRYSGWRNADRQTQHCSHYWRNFRGSRTSRQDHARRLGTGSSHPGGCFDLHADYMIQTDDGAIIHVINQGMMCPNSSGKHDALFTSPRLRGPEGEIRLAEWRRICRNGGRHEDRRQARVVRIRFYKAFPDQH